MSNLPTRVRLRRLFRRRKRQVEAAAASAEKQLDRNLIGRFENLLAVKRFVGLWIALAIALIVGCTLQILALSDYYQTLRPVPGGTYNEGIVGSFSNANPIFATGDVDTALSRLIFAGLMKYNNKNQLVGNLASGYTVDSSGKQYTVKLRPNLVWQDGQPLTAADVVFTYHLIQDPDVTSPLLSSWQGIQVTALDKTTVRFTLPDPLSSFPYSLTTGIVPEHILKNVPPNQLRSSSFNTTAPVGAGPFAFNGIQVNGDDPSNSVTLIALKPFARYYSGAPKLSAYVVWAYNNNHDMVQGFLNHDINAIAGLNEVPGQLKDTKSAYVYSFPLSAEKMVFFKVTDGVLKDKNVRQALIEGANTAALIQGLPYKAQPVDEPLLHGQLAYNPQYRQATYNQKAAADLLTKAGWALPATGSSSIRTNKDKVPLSFHIYAQDTPENRYVLQTLTSQWRAIGAEAVPVLQAPADFQTTLQTHSYDALLRTIAIGVDPDVFVYWDSTQADTRSISRLNFSELNSKTADLSLEAGRTRSNPALRAVKYEPFLQTWQAEAPSLGLYQPRALYVTSQPVAGLKLHTLNSADGRYNSVADWEIRTARVTN